MELVNLTPHDVNYIRDDGTTVTFPSQGVARAAQTTVLDHVTDDGYRITRTSFGEPVDLPEPVEGTYLIVSLATAKAAIQYGRGASDLLMPNETVRDSAGRIIGCRSFAVVE